MVLMSDPPVLSVRALNRALLARQHLLERVEMPALEMVEHLVGMQAQNPLDPYTALWSRTSGFRPDELAAAIEKRAAVRMGLLQTTLHLVTARDAVAMWPVVRGVLHRAWNGSPFRKDLSGVEVSSVLDAASAILADGPATMAAVGRRLTERWPDRKPTSLAYAARFHLPIVQVPPRGLWGRSGQASWQMLDAWLGRDGRAEAPPDPDALVLRYLAAFGPAGARDLSTWSWLTGMRAIVERLRPQLRVYRDEHGRELFDVPDGPLPDPDTPAPVRFLPEFDNIALSHADRARIITPAAFGRLTGWVGTFLVDGFVAGQWRLDRGDGSAAVVLDPFVALEGDGRDELVAEAERLLSFLAVEAADARVEFGVARKAPPPRPADRPRGQWARG